MRRPTTSATAGRRPTPARARARARAPLRPRASQHHRFGSDFAHVMISPPATLTPMTRRNLLTKIRPGLQIDVGILAIPPNQVTPAMPVQLGVDLIVERAAWFEPARNRLEMFDGNVYLRFVVSRPNVVHAATFALAHQQSSAAFSMAFGPGVPASASAGEGFLGEGTQIASVGPGSRYVGVVFTPRAGSWWIMLTSVTKDFLWRFYSADVTPLA